MPSWTIASIRAWPNAPRDCLLASTSRSVVTCVVRSVRFLCALSMMPSRSCSTRKLSMVLRVVCSIDWPTRWVTESSRSLTARAISAWRPASACAHRIDPAGGLALRAQHFAQAFFQFVGADGLRHRQFRAAPAGPRDHDGDHQQQDKRQRAEADQRVAGADRQVADHEKNLVHARVVADSPAHRERRGNIYGKSAG